MDPDPEQKYAGPWWIEWDDREARRCDSTTEVMAHLDDLHASALGEPRLSRISPIPPGPRLTVGLGQSFTFLSWEGPAFSSEFVSVGDESAAGEVLWTWLNRPSRVLATWHIPFAAAREAVLWYVATMEKAPFVRWKQP